MDLTLFDESFPKQLRNLDYVKYQWRHNIKGVRNQTDQQGNKNTEHESAINHTLNSQETSQWRNS